MSVKLVITDPHTHGPIELRALAHYFNCLAADVGGRASMAARIEPGSIPVSDELAADLVPLDNVGLVKDPVDPNTVISQLDPADVTISFQRADGTEVSAAEVFGGKFSEATDPVTPAPGVRESDAASSTAVSSTASPSADAVPGVQVDKRGLPWDARIHASSKAINQTDGLWRAKRGIDPAIVPGVEEELRALMAIPVSDAPAAEDDDLPPPIPDEDDDAPPPIPDDEASGVPTNLGELMLLATAAVAAKRMEMSELTAAAKELGVAGLPLLGARPDLVAKLYEMLKDKLA